jgi:hypothetical protein
MQMKLGKLLLAALGVAVAISTVSCGGGAGGPSTPPRTSFTVGGTVAGLRKPDAVVLKNGADSLRIDTNGTFAFGTALANGASYDVSFDAPAGYSCRVENGTGTISGTDVTKIGVVCAPFLLAGKEAPIQQPGGVAIDGSGNTYVLDTKSQVILRIGQDGNMTTVAGAPGLVGYRDGKGTQARFHFSSDSTIALDSSGNLGIADACNGVIRKMTPDGTVTTLSGVPTNRCKNYQTPDDFPQPVDGDARSARFGTIVALASDRAGGFYVADFDWAGLRHVMANGDVVSVRWPVSDPTTDIQQIYSLAVDSKGAVWVSDTRCRIWKYTGGGTPAYVAGKCFKSGADPSDGPGSAADFVWPRTMTIDAANNVYVGDVGSVRKVTPAGVVSTVAGSWSHFGSVDGVGKSAQIENPVAVSSDADGNLVFAEFERTGLRRLTAGGAVSTMASTLARDYVDGVGLQARLQSVRQPAVDSAHNVYVTDPLQHVIRRITPDGAVSLFAGVPGFAGSQDGPLASATFENPIAITAGPNDSLYLIDGSSVRRIANGIVSTVAQHLASDLFAIAVDRIGNVAISDSSIVRGVSVTGQVSVLADDVLLASVLPQEMYSQFRPQGLAYDAAGNLFISDTGTVAIYKLTPSRSASIFAGTQLVEGDEDGPVGKATFGYYGVDEMTIDDDGNLYLSGQGRLRKISLAGVATTVDLAWGNPYIYGLAWRNGMLYGMTRYAAMQIMAP